CLEGGNINLDNHAAATRHFPIRFLPGIQRGRGDVTSYPNRLAVDRVISWAREPAPAVRVLFQSERLAIGTTR
ncbi:MAG: hypothetical protein L0Y72_25070, partial [Gemmataceae bacterium]|nr:hypothetical protein [Gemmataceae bacterium]MCI0742317.1 hypothetical protein [Gemmataceae bacterium]